MIKISHVAKIIAQGIKMCGLWISYDSTIIGYALLASQDFHCKTELWHLWLEISLVELAKRGLLGHETELKVLKIDNDLKFVSKQFNEFHKK